MPPLTHGDAQDLLEAFKRGLETRTPDLIVELFNEDAEFRAEPFGEALVGANAIRAYWTERVARQVHVEFDPERIWVSGATVLASWHAAYTQRASAERVRAQGFLTMELDEDRKVARFRQWQVERVVGRDSTFSPEGGDH